jgi:hypothetical protein
MSRQRDIQDSINGVGERVSERVRHYAGEAAERAGSLAERGRDAGRRFSSKHVGYSRRVAHAAEDLADEANYQYRRLRRQVKRHPTATVAIVAGTVGAFFLLRHIFRGDDD